jgi:hypothetical protein
VNWTLNLALSVQRQIWVWGQVYPGLPALIYQRLNAELLAEPDAYLGPMMVPTSDRPYYILVQGQIGIPDGLEVFFAVRRDDAARTLDIIAARMTTPFFGRQQP